MRLDPTIRRITGKELTLFFASPVAYIFLGAFAALTLFIFFWAEAFFARSIADVRPLFEWMPILLIFLSSALCMRMWSEERRSGTIEHVLTQPVGIGRFVVGKFVACLILLVLALVVTLPLPLTVALIGDLDWGPVMSGYLATFLLGAAYLSVGLYVSARSDNQIVSLISSVALCSTFYLVGAPAITDFFGTRMGEWLRRFGTGARFDAITRGVIDLRDFYYYISLVALFLCLNTYALERERWSATGDRAHHRAWRTGTALLIANILVVHLWLGQLPFLRVDTTEGDLYSISEATHRYLDQLQEPLLIRGYFSAKTHPLLAPLAPQMRDLIREYEVAGGGRVRAEFVDPLSAPEMEEEANQKYGIRPVPFQVADRHQAALVNSYFDVLVQYGDAFQTLGFRDLIEIKSTKTTEIDVQLRNPEYDITRAVKKVLQSYQSGGNLFDTVRGDLQFTAYVSAEDRLPEALVRFKDEITAILEEKKAESGGRFKIDFVDPEAAGGAVARRIEADYGFKPMMASLFDPQSFYFYLTLTKDDQIMQLQLGDLTTEGFKRTLDAGIKRFSSGFTKTVALVAPAADMRMARFGMGGPQFNQLREVLSQEKNVRSEDLEDGVVDGEADLLFLAAPKGLDEKQLFAVDQFLMRGGTVVLATSPFHADLGMNNLSLAKEESGLADWLVHHGLKIADQVVLDPKNAAFPVPVNRQVGGFRFQEIRMLDYPYFPDLRGEGLNPSHPITRDLNQLTLAWASPIEIDAEKNAGRAVSELLYSSEGAWLSDSLNVMPQITAAGVSAFTPEDEPRRHVLGVVAAGRFASYFAGKDNPLLKETEDEGEHRDAPDDAEKDARFVGGIIEHSAESARIVLFSSNAFLEDRVLQFAGAVDGGPYLASLQLAANTVDWALEEEGLLGIRARGHFNRTLPPMAEGRRQLWEGINYGLAVFALAVIALVQGLRRRQRAARYAAALKA